MKSIVSKILIVVLIFLSQPILSQSALSSYSLKHDLLFKRNHKHAIDLFERLNYKSNFRFSNGQDIQLLKFENDLPLFYTTHNASIAEYTGISSTYEASEFHSSLSGRLNEIGLWDAGHPLKTHQEFENYEQDRILIEDEIPFYNNHTTHISGTIAASGINPLAKGMAFECIVYSKDYINDLSEMAKEAEKRVSFISNHSYGPVSGWLYNSQEEEWYWYGDIGVSNYEDYKFGFYGSISSNLDELAYLAPYYLMVVSSGNDRDDAPPIQPISHKVWIDKWKSSNEIRDADGGDKGFDCLGMNAVAKNVLTIGAIDSNEGGIMSVFSAWGPSDDGRIKPDIVAPGVRVLSSIASNNTEYSYYSGTSMSAACVTGGLA